MRRSGELYSFHLWALEIDDAHLLAGFESGTTFHPTFLYESLWSLALCFVLLWIDRKFRPGLGQLMAMYVMGYGVGRFWVEGLRIDRADELGGLRWNQWVAVAAVVGGAAVLAVMRRNPIVETADPFADRNEMLTELDPDGELDQDGLALDDPDSDDSSEDDIDRKDRDGRSVDDAVVDTD